MGSEPCFFIKRQSRPSRFKANLQVYSGLLAIVVAEDSVYKFEAVVFRAVIDELNGCATKESLCEVIKFLWDVASGSNAIVITTMTVTNLGRLSRNLPAKNCSINGDVLVNDSVAIPIATHHGKDFD